MQTVGFLSDKQCITMCNKMFRGVVYSVVISVVKKSQNNASPESPTSTKVTLKEHSTFGGEICSFCNSPRVKQLSFTIFQSIQPISGSGGRSFSVA